MTASVAQAVDIRNAFDVVEESYEFMLAYAAQGRKHEVADGEPGGESQIRNYLRRFQAALAVLQTASQDDLGGAEGAAFREHFLADTAVVNAILSILLARGSISSEMIDNTAGLIAMRSFLTNVFFIDQVVLPPR